MTAIHGLDGLSMPLSVTRKCSIFAHFIGVFLLVLTECLCYCHDDFPLSFAPPFHLCRQYCGDSIVAIPFTAPLRLEVADCNLGVPFGFFLVSQSLSFCSTNLSVGCLSYSPNTSLTKKYKKYNIISIVVLIFFSYLCKENHSLDAVAPRGRVGM